MHDVAVAELRALIRRTQELEERIREVQQSIGRQARDFCRELAAHQDLAAKSLAPKAADCESQPHPAAPEPVGSR